MPRARVPRGADKLHSEKGEQIEDLVRPGHIAAPFQMPCPERQDVTIAADSGWNSSPLSAELTGAACRIRQSEQHGFQQAMIACAADIIKAHPLDDISASQARDREHCISGGPLSTE